MTHDGLAHSPRLEWGVASATQPGESACGDLHVVHHYPGGALVGVVDGLGHGAEAAAAASQACDELRRFDGRSVISLTRQCHQALMGTRGVVMNVAVFAFADDSMSWLGIGNVEGILLRKDPDAVPRQESVLARGGVVGLQLPLLRVLVTTVVPGDLLVFATDGVRPEFIESLSSGQPSQLLADQILKDYGKGTDDALVLVARYLERQTGDP